MKELFDNYAKTYETEEFVKGTIGEIDFIEKKLITINQRSYRHWMWHWKTFN